MNEILIQHVVLSDGEFDRLTGRLALAQAVVEAAREVIDWNGPGASYLKLMVDALKVYDRSATQEREGSTN